MSESEESEEFKALYREIKNIADKLDSLAAVKEIPRLRDMATKNAKDIDVAWSDIRHLHTQITTLQDVSKEVPTKVMATIKTYVGIACFFILAIQGMGVWYAEKLISRADWDHEAIIVLQSQISNLKENLDERH